MAKYRNPDWFNSGSDREKVLRERGHIFWDTLNEQKEPLLIKEIFSYKLLNKDGVVVLLVDQPDELELFHEKMVTRGEFKDSKQLDLISGPPSMCHANSGMLWLTYKSEGFIDLVTGFGLSKDGIWRRHSWCFNKRNNHIVETTEKRVLYCGIKLTTEESESFVSILGG